MSKFLVMMSAIRWLQMGPRSKAPLAGFLVWFAGAVVLWFSLPYQPRFILPGTEDSVVAGFSPDGRILATSFPNWMDGTQIRLRDINTGKEIGNLHVKDKSLEPLQFSSDGKMVMIGSLSSEGNDKVFFFDTETSKELASIKSREARFGLGYLTPNGKTYVFMSGARAIFWNISAEQESLTLDCWPLRFSHDGKWFISRESADELGVRSSTTGQIRVTIPCKVDQSNVPIFSSDGGMIAHDYDGNVIVWDASTGRELATLKSSTSPTFSRDGKRLAVFHIGNIRLWDTSSWQVLGEDHHIPHQSLPIRSVKIWPGPGPKDMRVVFFEDRWISSGIFGHWMSYLGINISGRESKEMRIVDLESWKQLGEYPRHGEVHLLPDGRSFVDDSRSGNSKWSGKPFVVFDAPPRRPIAHITLWPLPLSVFVILIFWILVKKRSSKEVLVDQV